ncbi:hypothetical protein GCM10017687_82530 [Streptomyces echinatus]
MIEAPIFHCERDDPEAVVRVARLAFEFRQAFNKDVVIDPHLLPPPRSQRVGQPGFTQPLMYDLIDRSARVRKLLNEVPDRSRRHHSWKRP